MTEHILIIDSDLQELRRLREILAREGYNIMTASDDKTAQELCARLPIKLVLADVKLLGFAPTKRQHVKSTNTECLIVKAICRSACD
jgi:PleD family two-component response regulator